MYPYKSTPVRTGRAIPKISQSKRSPLYATETRGCSVSPCDGNLKPVPPDWRWTHTENQDTSQQVNRGSSTPYHQGSEETQYYLLPLHHPYPFLNLREGEPEVPETGERRGETGRERSVRRGKEEVEGVGTSGDPKQSQSLGGVRDVPPKVKCQTYFLKDLQGHSTLDPYL